MDAKLLSLSFKDHGIREKVVLSTIVLPKTLPSSVLSGSHGELSFIKFGKGKSLVGKKEISLCLS